MLITEAHRRNIEVHVWFNPYRANLTPNWNGLAPNHMANVLRQHAHPYDTYLWMDPGAKEVSDHLIRVVSDVATRYEIDGFNMDDYFYPYPDSNRTPFPDNATYELYLSQEGTLERDDWRRENVNNMITRVLLAVKTIRPGCTFSLGPFGLYRPGHPEGMPPPITGLDPYSALYADAKLWLEQGWVDFLAPQLYWMINSTGQSYPMLLDWWLDNNPARKYLFVANGVYRIDDFNWPVDEIVQQIKLSRELARRDKMSLGNILFSGKRFRDNVKGITDIFRTSVYTKKATIPRFFSDKRNDRSPYKKL